MARPVLWTVKHRRKRRRQTCRIGQLPAQERQTALVRGGEAEGESIVYANMDVSAMKPLTDGFMKRFPGTKATSVHFSGAAIITRIDTEARGGKAMSDVVLRGPVRRTGADR